MNPVSADSPLWAPWPFWILELDPQATHQAVERAYQNITGKLKLGIPGINCYSTPIGEKSRDEFQLREARAILLDPEKRILCEFWYIKPISLNQHTSETKADDTSFAYWKSQLSVR